MTRKAPVDPRAALTAGLLAGVTAAVAAPAAAHAQTGDAAVSALIKQADFWRARNRKDLADQALKRALAAAPRNPDVLAALARAATDSGDAAAARRWADQLKAVAPNDARAANLLKPSPAAQAAAAVAEARRLSRSGDSTGAAKAYKRAFPGGEPPSQYQLEYFQTLAGVSETWSEGRKGLERLAQSRPSDAAVQLAYAQALTYREETRRQGIERLAQMARGGTQSAQARQSWKQALLWLGPRASDDELYRGYLAGGADAEVAAKAERLKTDLARASQARAQAAANAPPPDRGAPLRAEGFQALKDNDSAKAEAAFQSALKFRANDADALGGLGLVRLRAQQFGEAKTYLERAIRAQPSTGARWKDALASADFFNDLRAAQAAAGRNAYAEAERIARPLAAGTSRDRALAQQLLGDVLSRQGRAADAESYYRQALAAQPANPDTQAGLIESLLNQNKFGEAEQLAARDPAIANAPLSDTRGRIEHAKANQLLAQGNLAGAAAAFEAALAADPTDPWIRIDFARFLASQGQAPAADGLMAPLAASLDPQALQAYALFAQQQNRPGEAYAALLRVPPQARTPDIARLLDQAYVDNAIVQARDLRRGGRNLEALTLLRGLLARPGLTVGAQGAIATALYDLGDTRQAQAMAQNVVMSGATAAEPGAYDGFVSILAKAGRDAEAAAVIRQVSATPAASTAQGRQQVASLAVTLAAERADRMRQAGDVAQAFDVLSQAFAVAPNNPRLLGALGRVYQSGNLPVQAEQVFTALLRQNPRDVDSLAGVTEAALARGDVKQARTVLAQAVRLSPNDANLYLLSARIEQAAGDQGAALKALEYARSLRAQQTGQNAPVPGLEAAPSLISPPQLMPTGPLGPNPFRGGGTAVLPQLVNPVTGQPAPSFAPAAYVGPQDFAPRTVAEYGDAAVTQVAFRPQEALAKGAMKLARAIETGFGFNDPTPQPAVYNGQGFNPPSYGQPQAYMADSFAAPTYATAYPQAQAQAYAVQAYPAPNYAQPAYGQPNYAQSVYPQAAPAYTQPAYGGSTYGAPTLPYAANPGVSYPGAAAQPSYPATPNYAAPSSAAPATPNYAAPSYVAPAYTAPAPAYAPPAQPSYGAAPAMRFNSPASSATPAYAPPITASPPSYVPQASAPIATAPYGSGYAQPAYAPPAAYAAPPAPLAPVPVTPRDGLLSAIDRQINDITSQVGPRVDTEVTFRGRTGEAGLSQLGDLTGKVTASTSPFGRGRLKASLTAVSLGAGDITQESLARFGVNPLAVARADISKATEPLVFRAPNPHTAAGVAPSVGYEINGASIDVGTTPIGFANKPLIVGGVSFEPQAGAFKPRIWIERRSVTDSVTSYAGTRDPVTGRRWGQVVRTTAGASLSYERGKSGFYGDAAVSEFDGKAVTANTSRQMNLGGYFRPFVGDTTTVQVGVNLNYQSYDNNQNVFSLGHGGYFSPERFASVSFPISYDRQGDRWRVNLKAAPGYQTYTLASTPYFPTDPTLQGAQDAIAAQDSSVQRGFLGSNKSGFGVNAKGAIDYRFTPRTHFGVSVAFDNFGQYNESVVGLYIRQSLGGSR